jgi:hypothetical protein
MFRRNIGFLLNKGAATMTLISKVLLGATAGAAILASSAITASAAVVCTGNFVGIHTSATLIHRPPAWSFTKTIGGPVPASPSASMKAAVIGVVIAGATFK